MKQQLLVTIEIQKNDRTYIFSMPYGAPIGEAYDSCHDVLKEIVQMGQNAANAAQKAAAPKED